MSDAPAPPLTTRAPLLLPAIAVVAGSWLAARATFLPVGLLLPLALLGLALGNRAGRTLAWLAAAMLWAHVTWVTPGRVFASLSTARPVTLSGEVLGCWSREEEGDSAALAVDLARQGMAVRRVAGRVWIHLPASEAPRGCGGRLAVRGYLKPPRRFRNAAPVEVGGWSLWVKSEALAEPLESPGFLARTAATLRLRLFPPPAPAAVDPEASRGAAQPLGDRPGLQLARALLLGDGRALPPEQREAMRRAGLAHLVAVSGLNVGMVGTLFLVLLVRVPRPLRLLGTLAGIALYALLVGPLPSLLRALAMATAVLLALLLRRLPQAANSLAAACLLLVLLEPAWVDDLGFQLSLAATVGLLALSTPLAAALRRLRWLGPPLAVTLAAQVATLPWSLAEFGRLSFAASLTNLLAVPWAGISLAVALLWAALSLIAPGLAGWLLPVLDWLAAPLELLPLLPPSPWISQPARTGWPLAVVATAALGWCVLRPRPWWLAVIAAAVGAGVVVGAATHRAPAGVELVMLDVGQGDALLLRDGHRAVLVDGGGWRRPGFGGRVLVPALYGLGLRRLDAVAVTHGDEDHCAGAADVVAELPVGEVWAPPGLGGACAERLRRLAGGSFRELTAGGEERIGRWRVHVLAPLPDSGSSDNSRSLVLRAESAGRSVLLTGDLDAGGEAALLARWGEEALHADVLKVGHHGSKSSSSRGFLHAVAPRLALISAGMGNPYGHPSPAVLWALHGRRATVLRTDLHGMVRVGWPEPSAQPGSPGPAGVRDPRRAGLRVSVAAPE